MRVQKRTLGEHPSKCTRNDNHTKKIKRRIAEIEKNAAIRTLNGNGASPNLPPLPKEDDEKEGLGTLFSHPYGALPFGNIFLANSDAVRQNGLGGSSSSSSSPGPNTSFHSLSRLNDEQVLSVLQFLDAKDLCKTLQTSRFLYVAAHHEELWRDLTLRKYGNGSKGFDFQSSWKDTYAYAYTYMYAQTQTQTQTELNTDGKSKAKKFTPHVPIAMKGIYSDVFFRSWLCRSFALQDSWLSINNVCVEDAKALTLDTFLTEYEKKNIPVVVSKATTSWPAVQKWNKDYLISETRGVTFRATSGAAPLPAQFTMESYASYCDSATEEAPLYLFDRTFSNTCPQLLRDFEDHLRHTCPFFDDNAIHGHDLFSLLGKGRRPDHRWIIIGPKRSGSSFHIDPNATHAWNAPIRGRKRWIFYPPGVNPPGVYPSPSGDDVIMPISLGEWFLTHWNDHVKQRSHPDPSKRPLECTVHPGEILFVPHGWWHCVLNLDDGMSIALTQNYVSASNLPDVLRFLKTKPQQISGCRDRPEAIQPDALFDQFTQQLERKRPALLKEAQQIAECGFGCSAWKDDDYDDDDGGDESKRVKTKTSILDRAKITKEDEDSRGTFSFSFL